MSLPGTPDTIPACYCGKNVNATRRADPKYGYKFHSWAKTCGDSACRTKFRFTGAIEAFNAAQVPPKCPGCSKQCRRFGRAGSTHLNKWLRTCGAKACIDVTRKLRKFKPRKCEHCENIFTPVNGNHKRWCLTCSEGDKKSFEYLRECNMTYAEAQALLKKQKGICALCPKPAVHLDHCHETKKVRGWLCHACNMHMAPIDKDPLWVLRALEYKHRATDLTGVFDAVMARQQLQ